MPPLRFRGQLLNSAESTIPTFWEKTMAFKVTDQCVNCGTCEPDCPVEAISEQNNIRVIDAEKCISCGTCAAECPAEAIVEE